MNWLPPGPARPDPAVWKPLHTDYWNALLQPFGLTVSDDMPFWAERFTPVFDADA